MNLSGDASPKVVCVWFLVMSSAVALICYYVVIVFIRTIEEDCLSGNHWHETALPTGKNKRCSEENEAYTKWQFDYTISFIFWTCWQSSSRLINSKISKECCQRELALANHLWCRLRQRFHSLARYQFLCTNISSGSSILWGMVIAVRVVSALLSKREDSHTLVCHQLI